jgi:hypothetical protein
MKGICFIEPLFHKVVSGEKTKFREIIKPQPDDSGLWDDDKYPRSLDSTLTGWNGTVDETGESKEFKPRYKPGETLYLKEPYSFDMEDSVVYKYNALEMPNYQWENKLFMPAEYARHFIKITGVRAERLQDISDEDCMKAGIEAYDYYEEYIGSNFCSYSNGIKDGFEYSCEAYAALIDSISGKGTWESNPFVWVYDFKLTK